MDIVGPVFELVNMISSPAGRCLKYHRSLDRNMNSLRRKLEELHSRREDMLLKIGAELHPRRKLKSEVQLWLGNVESIGSEIEKLEQEVVRRKYLSRAHLSKLILKKIVEVEKLHQKGNFPNGLVVDELLRSGQVLPTTTLIGEAMKLKMNEIWTLLMGDDVQKIGVCGMGGVGKTTILKLINNELLKETNKFDVVIWVTVSKDCDVIKLQNEIAQAMHVIPFEDEDKTRKAGMLLEMLAGRGRFVLILDDLWDRLSLEEVGVPEPSMANGSKLLVTTRSLDICRSLNCKVIKLDPLVEEEAFDLFLEKGGADILNFPALLPVVKSVVKQCAGLPLAIETVASSMRGVYDISEWRNAFNELSGPIKSVNDIEGQVFKQLWFSYDRLKDVKLKNCFLYCALYPEDFLISKEELIGHWIAEGLVDEMDSMQAEFDRGHVLLNRLINTFLLENIVYDEIDQYVKMHDLVRDMALHITSVSPRFWVKSGMQLRELPHVQPWAVDIEKVSLMGNCISKIPSGVPSSKCPMLATLLLSGNSLKEIPETLFMQIPHLKTLDLSLNPLGSLPNSISNLENLTTLLLGGCEYLTELPCLSKLQGLKKLDLHKTGIQKIPQGMEKFVHLRYLDLNFTIHLQRIPDGMLQNLSLLQHLAVYGKSVKGEEVGGLMKLETFEGFFHDLYDLKMYVKSLHGREGPSKYFIKVGEYPEYQDYWVQSYVKSVGLSFPYLLRDPVLLPFDIQQLKIIYTNNMRSLNDISSLKDATDLRECIIKYCDNLECVFSSFCIQLQRIESLRLDVLPNLNALLGMEAVAQPVLPPGTFFGLKTFEICFCRKIKKLFLSKWLQQGLQNLEEISICHCYQMLEIIAEDSESEEEGRGNNKLKLSLPKLRKLTLGVLPELKSICSINKIIVCDSVQHIEIYNCPKLKRIPLYLPHFDDGRPFPPPSLQQIEIYPKEWLESVEWEYANAKDILRSFLHCWDRDTRSWQAL